MDFEALQRQRKSCRAFAPKPVPRELLTRLVDTARLSPSACNSQPWHFIVVDEDEAKAKMVDALVDDGLTGCPWGDKVPAFILICEEKARLKPSVGERYGSQYFSQMDIGMAAMGLCYAATALGLGTCMIRRNEPGKNAPGLPHSGGPHRPSGHCRGLSRPGCPRPAEGPQAPGGDPGI